MHSLNRRQLAMTLVSMSSPLSSPLLAQSKYPNRPVTLIVPQAAGGANDAIARVIGQKLTDQTGQTFIIDNRPGAGGNVGTAFVAKAKNDGYTLLLNANSAQVINPALYKTPGFDPVKDFEAITPVATAGYVMVANLNFPAKNIAEMIAYVKTRPGQINIGSAGNGTLNHLIGEMFKKATGTFMTHIPYRSAAAAVTDLIGGQVQVSVQSLPSSIAHIKSGKIKALGVVNEKRLAVLPDTPTIGETLKGFGSTPWYGLFAPAGTPKEIVDFLQTEVNKALDAQDAKDRLASVGCEPMKSSSADFAALVKADLPRWEKIVKDSGAKLD